MNPNRKLNFPERVLLTLQGNKPDRIPFISRMDFWFRGLNIQDKIPEPYRGLNLSEVHQAIGFGREDWYCPCAYKYKKMELILYFEGQEILHEYEPEISYFPGPVGKSPY